MVHFQLFFEKFRKIINGEFQLLFTLKKCQNENPISGREGVDQAILKAFNHVELYQVEF